MRKIAGLLSVAAIAALAAPAAAAPTGNGLISESFDCGDLGEVTITHGQGSNGWVADGHFAVASFSGFQNGELAFSKSFGEKKGMSGLVECSAVEDGFTIVVTAYPVPPGS